MHALTQTENNFIVLLRAGLEDRVLKADELSEDVNVLGILRLAYSHKLWHMILSALPEELLPRGVDRRHELFRRVAAAVGTTSAFLELWKMLEDEGFHPIVVKGIVCRTLYLHPELRPSSDEDLYIPENEFESCCEFLARIGMKPNQTPYKDYGEIGWQGQNGLYIELHRDLFEGESFKILKDFFSFDTLKTSNYLTHYGTTVTSMDPHGHFLYLLLHAYKHFVHSGFGIRQVCDIGIWAREHGDAIDWQTLGEQCDRVSMRGFTKAILGIAKELGISFSVPEDWESGGEYSLPMLKDILCGGIYGSADADRVHSGTMTLNAVKASGTGKKPSLMQSVFPSRDSLKGRYPYLKKHPILLPVAWASRIASYAKRSSAGETNAERSIAIGKERIDLLRFYGILK